MSNPTGEPRPEFFPTFRRLPRLLFSVRFWRFVLFSLLCVATLAGLFYGWVNLKGELAWRNLKREYEAKGECLNLEAFIPPAVPDDQNFAMTPLLAPLLDYVVSTNGAQWRDTNVWQRLRRISNVCVSHPGAVPPFGTWSKGTNTDLAAWQTYYRDLARRTNVSVPAGLPAEMTRRYGLTDSTSTASRTRPPIPPEEIFPVPSQPGRPAEDVLLALSKWNKEMAELKAASLRPYARFPIHYEEGVSALLPHLAFCRQFTALLSLRAVAFLEAPQPDRAFEDVMLCFRLLDAIKGEPISVSQAVRVASLSLLLQPVWEGLEQRRWTADQLFAVQKQLEALDFLRDYNRALRCDRVLFNRLCEDLIGRREDSLSFVGSLLNQQPFDVMLLLRHGPRGWIRQNQVLANRLQQESLIHGWEKEGGPFEALTSASVVGRLKAQPVRPWNFLASQVPFLKSDPIAYARGHAFAQLAMAACALERYHLAHGAYPDKIDDLIPQFLRAVPRDVMSGQPLKFRRTNDGRFVLYSIGQDRRDNNGVYPVGEEGDWVWRYPVSPR